VKARTLPRVLSNPFGWFLTVLRGTLALHNSTAALLSSFSRFFLTYSFPLYWLRKWYRFTFLWTAAKKKAFVLYWWNNTQTAIYNPFSGKLYFRGVYISGRQIINFSDWPRLLAVTVDSPLSVLPAAEPLQQSPFQTLCLQMSNFCFKNFPLYSTLVIWCPILPLEWSTTFTSGHPKFLPSLLRPRKTWNSQGGMQTFDIRRHCP
jgi:hypothetical protein